MNLPALSDVVAAIESNNNPAAIRFEQATFYSPDPSRTGMTLLGAISRANRCNMATSKMIAACSWGRFQIMGFNLYCPTEMAYGAPIAQFLSDVKQQDNAFREFIARNKIDYTTEEIRDNLAMRSRFAAVYNGPGNVADYAAKLYAAINRLTVNIPEQFA